MPLAASQRDRILRFDGYLPSLRPLSGMADAGERRAALEWCERIYRMKLVPDCRLDLGGPAMVVFSGGTNVGKSTLFNRVLAEEVSLVSPFARTTKSPALYVHRSLLDTWLANGSLPGYRRAELRSLSELADEHADAPHLFYRVHEHAEFRDLVLVDSPDLDSNFPANRRIAEDLLLAADAVVFVTSPEKYNDEACVEFLARAAGLGKRLLVVLNKAEGEEVLEDLAGRVLPGLLPRPEGGEANVLAATATLAGSRLVPFLGFDRHTATLRVLTAPYVRAGETVPPAWAEELRALLDPRDQVGAVRERAFRGAVTQFARDLGPVVGAVRAEARAVAEFRRAVTGVGERCAADYRRQLEAAEFWELDQVYKQVLATFRIPVLDDFYDTVGRAGRHVVRGFRALFGRGAEAPETRREAERRDVDRARALECLQACYLGIGEVADRAAGALRPAAQAAVPPLPGTARLAEIGQTHVNVVREFTARWIRDETERTVARLKASPYVTNIVRVVKGTLQLGSSALSVYLTGGIHPHDLIVAPATERGMKYLLDAVGGGIYYQNLRREFLDQRQEIFAYMLQREVSARVLEQIPEPIDPARLEAIEEERALMAEAALAEGSP